MLKVINKETGVGTDCPDILEVEGMPHGLMSNEPRDARILVKENLFVTHMAGSHAYGTNTMDSDIDRRGIFVADPINILSPFFKVNEVIGIDGSDEVHYEYQHYIELLVNNNPNIVETLWVDEGDILFSTPEYWELRSHRSKFLSSKIAFTTSGYAVAQLKKIRGRERWITNPEPVERPKQYQFLSMVYNFTGNKEFKFDAEKYNGFNEHGHILYHYGNDLFGVYVGRRNGKQIFNEQGDILSQSDYGNELEDTATEWISKTKYPSFIVKFNREDYKLACTRHKQYWEWKTNRNEVRAKLEEKYHYDTKNALHCVRLLRMGLEALRDGVILIKRPDAEELLAIRNGSMGYEELIKYAEHMDHEIREVWYKKTKLPHHVDLKQITEITVDIRNRFWKRKGLL